MALHPIQKATRLVSRAEKFLYRHHCLPIKPLTLPQFMVIGARKCGTTWLFENLHQHPDIFLASSPERKGVEYFDQHFQMPLISYARLFETAQRKIRGEVTASYNTIPPYRIRFIYSIMPALKLVLLLRNPVERVWSEAYMQLLAMPGRSVNEVPEQDFIDYFNKDWVKRNNDYPRILDNWLSVFPRRQLFIGLYDQIASEPRKLLEQIFRHIGAKTDIDWSTLPYQNIIVPPAGPGNRQYDPARGMTDNRRLSSTHFMPETIRAFLQDRYGHDIHILIDKYQLPVQPWLDQ